MGVIWPEIFTNKDFEYPIGAIQPNTVITDGLIGWSCCMARAALPENFGKGMAKILEIVGVATPDDLLKMAEKLDR